MLCFAVATPELTTAWTAGITLVKIPERRRSVTVGGLNPYESFKPSSLRPDSKLGG